MVVNKIKIIEKFLSSLEIEGVCGFSILEDNLGIQVVVVISSDYTKQTKPGFVASRVRSHVSSEIEKYLGFDDVYVGSTSRNC